MGILVCYDDFTYDVVNDFHFDYLVSTGSIVGFDRSGQWVKQEETIPTPHPIEATKAEHSA
ncbi:hypothetical protein Gbem_0990 [Citrifermentans bemidjiense Bem]|uniref:Uncharacterized protein n=1 Tax=Citrifermentans bemidjiense (strain ATCC BAA-1014 / DSM 16622 / JCM 12645 / Bem) TaxID=404380 RepID=B5EGE6_CITBB|nr:hypothetical protein [Citrifermentans bemidjiense]ACH38011.1 hypothetical protein Gbem_0990 [Citrifermentans bemidjiense Bem]